MSASDTSEAERAAIVAWLRELPSRSTPQERRTRAFAVAQNTLVQIADAIASLAHHEPKS